MSDTGNGSLGEFKGETRATLTTHDKKIEALFDLYNKLADDVRHGTDKMNDAVKSEMKAFKNEVQGSIEGVEKQVTDIRITIAKSVGALAVIMTIAQWVVAYLTK